MMKWLFGKSFSFKDAIVRDHLVLWKGFPQACCVGSYFRQFSGQAFDILNHISMEHRDDDDDDDDVSFAKWMSSFWGHSWRDKDERGLREHHRLQDASYRKTSLPCPFPVLPSITSSDCYPRRHSHEDQEFQNHPPMRYYRKSSVDESFRRPVESKKGSRSKIQEFSDSFEQQLCLKNKHTVSSGTKSRKERNERQCMRTEVRSHKKVEDGGSSTEEELKGGHMAPLVEKRPE